MNGEMNNNYNGAPNYNYEKKNNGVKILLIVFIILVAFLIGLLSYKIFIADNKNDKKDNNVVENKEKDINVSTKLSTELKDNVIKFPYTSILDNSIYEKALNYGIQKSSKCCSNDGCVIDNADNKCKNYIKELEQYDIKKVYDNDSQGRWILDSEEVLNNIRKVYKNIELIDKKEINFNDHFADPNLGIMVFLKDINKIIYYQGGGGMTGQVQYFKEILDTLLEDNVYKIKFIEVGYNKDIDKENECYVIDKNNNKTIVDCSIIWDNSDSRKDYMLSHKDELSQYEISFKINSDNTYEFKNIKKIN